MKSLDRVDKKKNQNQSCSDNAPIVKTVGILLYLIAYMV